MLFIRFITIAFYWIIFISNNKKKAIEGLPFSLPCSGSSSSKYPLMPFVLSLFVFPVLAFWHLSGNLICTRILWTIRCDNKHVMVGRIPFLLQGKLFWDTKQTKWTTFFFFYSTPYRQRPAMLHICHIGSSWWMYSFIFWSSALFVTISGWRDVW